MKKKTIIVIISIIAILLNLLFNSSLEVFATDSTNYISLSNEIITVNGEEITKDSAKDLYLSNSINNGGSSEDAIKANVEISNIININKSGTYEFTGKLSDGQISVNSNEINGEVVIVLNNANITCEDAPAIIVFSKDTKATNCTVKIKTASGSVNTITGARLKQSVQGWSDQDKILYYIEKGNDDDGSYYEQYKYDGAISSDISLTFEGEGNLTINSSKKEGIETKRDITFNSGNYVINSLDDGINASSDGESVITINDGTILVNLKEESEEGDGIDSNGSLIINGGKVFAFASEGSEDSGLDSDLGITINGGYVVGIGNMADAVSESSKQKFVQFQFTEKVSKDNLITITDENKNAVVAFKSDREYKVLVISTKDLEDKQYLAYEGGKIDGTSENGLYTKITSYEEGTIKQSNNVATRGDMNAKRDIVTTRNSNIYYYTLAILGVLLVILIIVVLVLKKKGEFKMKGKILTLIIGIIIGAIITTAGFLIYNKINVNSVNDIQRLRGGQMQNNGQRPEILEKSMPNGEMSSGKTPQMPGNNSTTNET